MFINLLISFWVVFTAIDCMLVLENDYKLILNRQQIVLLGNTSDKLSTEHEVGKRV